MAVLAVQRHGVHIREKVADLRLRMGDILLVEAEAPALEALRDARNFVLLEGVQEQVTLPHKARWALAVVLSVIVLATADIPGLPISVLAVAGALAMVLIGCLSTRDAYRAMDLPILVPGGRDHLPRHRHGEERGRRVDRGRAGGRGLALG